MKNFVANGDSIQLIADAPVTGGQLLKKGKFVGVVVADAAIGEQFTLMLTGVYTDLPSASATTFDIGDQLYLDSGNLVTSTASGNTYFAKATKAKLNGEVICDARLDN